MNSPYISSFPIILAVLGSPYINIVFTPCRGYPGFYVGGTEAERRRRESARIAGLRMGLRRGCPPPQPTRGSGGASWAPQQGPWQSPGRQRILGIYEAHGTLLVERKVLL